MEESWDWGTDSPNHVLHINHATPVIQFTDTAQGILGYFGDATDFLPNGAGNDSFGLRSEGDLRFGTGGNNTRMVIASNGVILSGNRSDNQLKASLSHAKMYQVYLHNAFTATLVR